MERIIGIDLGTTNSVVAICEKEQPVVLLNAEGVTSTPSAVLYPQSGGAPVVGELAKRQMVLQPDRVIRSVKRFIGRLYDDLPHELISQLIGYEVVPGTNGGVKLLLGGGMSVSPEAASAEILKRMKETAESYLGEQVERAVITVPAYFNDTQRQCTKIAAEMAGLKVARIINEPTAAALAYGLNLDKNARKVVVFDLGGGTLDVSILEISDGIIEVLATCGDVNLGGDNFDEALCRKVCEEFKNETGIDLTQDVQAMQRLCEALERCKCELSSVDNTMLSLPFICAGEQGPVHLNRSLSRGDFEELLVTFLPRMTVCCENALGDAGLKVSDIDVVLPVGGSSRIPAVRKMLATYFAKDPQSAVDPEVSVAMGAAIQGSIITGAMREVLLLDVTPLSLGIEVGGGLFSVLIPRNSSIPVTHKRKFTTVRDNQRQVRIHILQGERRIAKENHTLGVFELDGIVPAPKEIPEIEVSFQIDTNGILSVSAMDTTTGVSNSITIVSFGVADQEEADAIAAEAESKVAEDLAQLQKIRVKARGDETAEPLRKLLSVTDLSDELRRKILESLFKYDIAANSENIEAMEEQILVLQTLASRVEDHRIRNRSRRS